MKTWTPYSDRLRSMHIPVSRHAPAADFAAIAPRYPVFRVVRDEGGEP